MPDIAHSDELEKLRRQVSEQQATLDALQVRCDAAEALAEEYQALFQLAGVGISAADPDGHILRVNAKLCELLGYSAEELQRMTFVDFTHPDDREPSWDKLHALYEGRIPEMETEKRYLRRDGSTIWAALNATVVRNPDGSPRYSVAVIRDVTARVEYEQALRAEEEKLRLVTENIRDVFWMSTPGVGQMIYISPGYERIWGRSCESLYRTPRSFLDAIHPEDKPRVFAGLKEHAEGRWNFEYRIVRGDGGIRWIRDRGFPIYGDDGQLRFLTGVATDCTGQKEAELRADEALALARERSRDLERANRYLEQFAAAASHDLKAPLRAIGQLAAWVEEDTGPELPAQAREHLDRIQARIAHMNQLVDDLLTYARAGQKLGPAATVDVDALVRQQWESVAAAPGFRLHLAEHLPRFDTQATPLAQVFHNLLGNAVKHHDRSDGNVWVDCRDEGERYRFQVADDGPGIAPHEQQRVFDIFYIGDRRSPDSTGLGLALVKKLVEDCGGEIGVGPRDGGGCCFKFSWPKRCPAPRS